MDRPYTVLERAGGKWDDAEFHRLVNGLRIPVAGDCSNPEFLILVGNHKKEDLLEIIGRDSQGFTVRSVIGWDNPELPFSPDGW